ncbi:MAG TPA: tRNA pseudouridine(55) synthase TruB [Casimicrobiaceae bacterium]|nr:tRNA pseudouridine(55) synthase TruB [Casimicrobiaceae bacterium]
MTAPATGPVQRRRVDGVLLLDKPRGLSSNAALQRAKHLYRAGKAGHTGTLDPLATGLLPVCFGEATKFANLLLDADKSYLATLRLGATTTTGDAEGEIVEERPVGISRSELESLLPRFLGSIAQVPPRYSALKRDGRSYYEYAREGVEIDRRPRPVTIVSLELAAWRPPEAELRVRCGKGTYVRALAEDIGAALGCGAHLSALSRTGAGDFSLADAISLDALERCAESARDALLRPVDALVGRLDRVDLDRVQAERLSCGQALPSSHGDGVVRVYADGSFAGVAEVRDRVLRARRMLAQPEAPGAAPVPRGRAATRLNPKHFSG